MTFTSDQVVALFCFVLTILQIINISIVLKNKAQDPNKKRDQDIADLRTEVEKLKGEVGEQKCQLELNWTKLDKVKGTTLDSTRVLMQAVQALLKHEVDGNNTDGLKKSAKDIDQFVWEHFGGEKKEDDK